jgi:recombination DNA repair RAD52 pathway protein
MFELIAIILGIAVFVSLIKDKIREKTTSKQEEKQDKTENNNKINIVNLDDKNIKITKGKIEIKITSNIPISLKNKDMSSNSDNDLLNLAIIYNLFK